MGSGSTVTRAGGVSGSIMSFGNASCVRVFIAQHWPPSGLGSPGPLVGLLHSACVSVSQSHASVTWAACCVALGAVGVMPLCMLHVHLPSDLDEQD